MTIRESYQSGYEEFLKEAGIIGTALKPIGWAGRQLGLWGTKSKVMRSAEQLGAKAMNPGTIARANQMAPKGVSYGMDASGNLARNTAGWWDKKSTLGKAGTIGGAGVLGSAYVGGKVLDSYENKQSQPGPAMQKQQAGFGY